MQLETSKAAHAVRVKESTVGQPRKHCAACGHHPKPTATHMPVCERCGSYLAPNTDDIASRKPPLSFSWGDAIVVIGMAILAYLLPVMAWDALFGP
ncbi:MAG TPA: hypothetical protein VG826_28110 [Pirellulales bacterium]|nr:hypothetical protein [Pirellulales bacterium]